MYLTTTVDGQIDSYNLWATREAQIKQNECLNETDQEEEEAKDDGATV